MTMDQFGVTGEPGRKEGRVTRAIEKRTSRVPSGLYLTLAVGSIAASALTALRGTGIKGMVRRPRSLDVANFIGQWAPTLLILGLYNKLVKIEHELAG